MREVSPLASFSGLRAVCSTLLLLPLTLPALIACPPGGNEGEGEAGEGEGEGDVGDPFTLVSATDIDAAVPQVVPGFSITARSDGRFVVAWFEGPIAETVECERFGGGEPIPGPAARLMVGDEQADGSVRIRVADPLVPNTKEDAVDLAITADDRVLVAYSGGEVTRTFCTASDLMLATENGDTFTVQTLASSGNTGATCRGDAGGDPYCNQGEVVGLYPSIAVEGDSVAVSHLDTHFGFGDEDINSTDLELVVGTVGGAFTPMSVNTETGAGYYGSSARAENGNVIIGHNIVGGSVFVDADGNEFTFEAGIWVSVVDEAGALVNEAKVLPGVFTASRVAVGASADGYFAAAHNRSDESLVLFQSRDDGATWTPSGIEQLGRSGRDPNLLFTDDGRLVAVYGHCRDNTNQDGCDARKDGVRLAIKDGTRFVKFTIPGDAEDLEGIGLDAARAPGDQIVTVSLNASQNRLTVHRVQVN